MLTFGGEGFNEIKGKHQDVFEMSLACFVTTHPEQQAEARFSRVTGPGLVLVLPL